MRGCLFVLALGAVALVLVVVVGLPAVASGMIGAGLAAAGLQSADLAVTVTSDPPTDLLGLHADRVHVTAHDATFRQLDAGSLDIVLGDVDLLDRSAGSVTGRLDDVVVDDPGAGAVRLRQVTLGGTSEAVTASMVVPAAEVRQRVSDAIAGATGIRPDAVKLAAPDRISVSAAGLTQHGTLQVTPAGDLVARLTDGPAAGLEVQLLQGASLPVRLERATVTSAGDLRLDGTLSVNPFG